jgi:cytochrome b561/polyisoprenoid-binding protein YceI
MTTRNTALSFGTVTRTFHWLTALLIFAAFPLGVIANDMAFDTSEALALKAQVFSVHKTLGVSVFIVALLRILWAIRETKPVPLHPDRKAETFAAETVHWALYLSLVIVPLSGWIHHSAVQGFAPILWPFGQDLPFVPKSEAVAKAASATHWLFTKVMFAAVALHIAGALKHVFLDRDLTLARMTKGTSAGAGQTGHSTVPLLAALAIFTAGAVGAWQIAASAAAPPPAEATAQPDPSAVSPGGNWLVSDGTLGFTVRQMGAEVAGTLPVWTADITFDEATGTGTVRVEIDVAQLALGSVTDQAKGPEFFAVATHPKAVFSGNIAPAGTAFEVAGTLALRGMEVPVTLPFELTIADKTATMAGRVTLDRRDFGMGKSYADEATVGFAVVVAAELTATRKE